MRAEHGAIAVGRRRSTARAVAGALALGMLTTGGAVLAAAPSGSASTAHAQYLSDQWGLSAVGAPSVWQYANGAGVDIGIVDTGVDLAQGDLQGKVVAQQSFVSSPSSGCATPAASSAQDDNGHGTHVAGIAAASGAVGVDGVAPAASLVVAKVLDCQGAGSYQDVDTGIHWVVDHGARVVNLSLGDAGTGLVDQSQLTGQALGSALQYAWDHGAVPVVAAGNNANGLLGLGEANYANLPAIVVAATGPNGRLASYSNSIDNAQWGVAAPGGDDPNGPTTPTCGLYDSAEILSTYWSAANTTSCYATDEGTSMATPFVTGAVALLLGRGLTPSQAVQTLLSTANHSVSCGSACSGLLNAQAAVLSTVAHSSPGGSQPPPGGGSNGASSGTRTTTARSGGGTTGTTSSPPSTAAGPAAASAGPSTSTSAPRTQRRTTVAARTGHGSGSGWWLPLLVVAGLALLAGAAVVGRRLLVVRRGGPGGGPPTSGPAPDPSETGPGIPAPI